MIWKFVAFLLLGANLALFYGSDLFTNLIEKLQNGKVQDINYEAQPLVRGVKDIKIGNASFQQEVYYGFPGIYSLEEQLEFLGVTLEQSDKVVMIPSPQFGIGGKIEITRANQISLIDGKTQKNLSTWSTTIAELLEEEQIALGENDTIFPPTTNAIEQGSQIKITRIGIREEQTTETIAFATVTETNPNQDVCWQQVTQVGKPGILTKFFNVTYHDGDEVSRSKVKEEITTPPISQITQKGSKVTSYGQGKASWYRWRAGEAAHNTLPRGTMVKVTNLANGRSTVVKITDRGIHTDAIIDLDVDSFEQLAPRSQGIAQVKLEKVCS